MPKPKPLADDVSQYLERAAVAANEFCDDEAKAKPAAISTPRLARRFEKAFYDSFERPNAERSPSFVSRSAPGSAACTPTAAAISMRAAIR